MKFKQIHFENKHANTKNHEILGNNIFIVFNNIFIIHSTSRCRYKFIAKLTFPNNISQTQLEKIKLILKNHTWYLGDQKTLKTNVFSSTHSKSTNINILLKEAGIDCNLEISIKKNLNDLFPAKKIAKNFLLKINHTYENIIFITNITYNFFK